MTDKICIIEGCGKPVKARGYCSMHYMRLHRHKDLLIVRHPFRACKVPDCGERHYAKGYCKKHYTRWKYYGDPVYKPQAHNTLCSVEGCQEAAGRNGLCILHRKVNRYRKRVGN